MKIIEITALIGRLTACPVTAIFVRRVSWYAGLCLSQTLLTRLSKDNTYVPPLQYTDDGLLSPCQPLQTWFKSLLSWVNVDGAQLFSISTPV
jgi:hypothetical protein